MLKVLMCGPLASSGGVSTHTKNLIDTLSAGNTGVLFYNYYNNQVGPKKTNFGKLYRRTVGLFLQILLHRNEYYIIHDQTSGGIFSFVSSITASIASKIVHKKLIITFHHSRTEEFVKKYKSIFNFVLKNVNTMILVSDKQKGFISKMFPMYSNKLTVIPNGYDSTLFFPRDTGECRRILNIPMNKKVVFNISNLIDIKGHKYLVEAIGNIVKDRSDVYCIIAGKGYLKESLETQIRESKLEDFVKLVGWVRDEEIPVYINASDLFVLPSLGEGNPIVMFEAMSCGKPFIGTKVGGIPEIISSEEYGLLCEPGNSQELEIIIKIALEKKWNYNEIEAYSKRFTWKEIANKTLSIYNEM